MVPDYTMDLELVIEHDIPWGPGLERMLVAVVAEDDGRDQCSSSRIE